MPPVVALCVRWTGGMGMPPYERWDVFSKESSE